MDRIEITVAASPDEATGMVERGAADVMADTVPAEVAQRYLDDPSLAGRSTSSSRCSCAGSR